VTSPYLAVFCATASPVVVTSVARLENRKLWNLSMQPYALDKDGQFARVVIASGHEDDSPAEELLDAASKRRPKQRVFCATSRTARKGG